MGPVGVERREPPTVISPPQQIKAEARAHLSWSGPNVSIGFGTSRNHVSTRLHPRRPRARHGVRCALELLEPRRLLAADLTPYQPAGWADKILLTTNEGDFSNA